MNVQINYKNIKHTKNSTNHVLFTDENYNIKHQISTTLNELEKTTTDLMVANELIRKLKNRETNLQVEKNFKDMQSYISNN